MSYRSAAAVIDLTCLPRRIARLLGLVLAVVSSGRSSLSVVRVAEASAFALSRAFVVTTVLSFVIFKSTLHSSSSSSRRPLRPRAIIRLALRGKLRPMTSMDSVLHGSVHSTRPIVIIVMLLPRPNVRISSGKPRLAMTAAASNFVVSSARSRRATFARVASMPRSHVVTPPAAWRSRVSRPVSLVSCCVISTAGWAAAAPFGMSRGPSMPIPLPVVLCAAILLSAGPRSTWEPLGYHRSLLRSWIICDVSLMPMRPTTLTFSTPSR
mmetsp:Transcript_4800/g.19601  ORF Transcript_4800/g.19601 Transcript_4800/m.19601 type:complete len:267 (+) Transcript_4800:501-1301(+)